MLCEASDQSRPVLPACGHGHIESGSSRPRSIPKPRLSGQSTVFPPQPLPGEPPGLPSHTHRWAQGGRDQPQRQFSVLVGFAARGSHVSDVGTNCDPQMPVSEHPRSQTLPAPDSGESSLRSVNEADACSYTRILSRSVLSGSLQLHGL